MSLSDVFSITRSSFQQVWFDVITFLPILIVAIIVFVIGAFIATQLGKIVEQIIRASKVDSLLAKLEFERALEKGGIKLNAGGFIGALVKWFLIVVAFNIAVTILGNQFSPVTSFLNDVLRYLPNVVVAALILVIAALVSHTLEAAIRGGVSIAGFHSSVAGVVVRWAVWIFAVVAALEQLGVAVLILQTVVTGLVAALALAFGLAFGLGGKDWAARVLEETKRDMM